MFNVSPELFRVCPVVLFWIMFYGYDLFYVIPVCLSHLSLDKLFIFFELVDITLGAIQVLRNADGGGGVTFSRKKVTKV